MRPPLSHDVGNPALDCTSFAAVPACAGALFEVGLLLLQETQTKPEGQIHFFPVLFDGKQVRILKFHAAYNLD